MKNLSVFIILIFIFLQCNSQKNVGKITKNELIGSRQASIQASDIVLGAARLDEYLPLLKDKTVAMVVNQTSQLDGRHIVDLLLEKKVNVKKIFAPEHGFRGTAADGEKIVNSQDPKTGLPIISLYGKDRKPSAAHLRDIDVVIFDIQDVGARFYTYISTMHYVMEACAENGKEVMVFDRPNPNGHYVDGEVLDLKFQSFVGMHAIPVVHGLTVGELAQMINGEKWLEKGVQCKLTVIKNKDYTHSMPYMPPIKTSPNMPNYQSILLYPSLCFFEGTEVSVGRGTDTQFQVIGSPTSKYGTYTFTPEDKPGTMNPPQKGNLCYGLDLRKTDAFKMQLSLKYLIDFYQKCEKKENFFLKTNHFDRLAGSETLKKMIIEGKSEAEIKANWQAGLKKYKEMRKKYLLYEDFE